MASRQTRLTLLLVLLTAFCVLVVARADEWIAVWERLGGKVEVRGEPIVAEHPVLSDHEIDQIRDLEPQEQARRLLQRAVNRYEGSRDLFAALVGDWHGKIRLNDPRLHSVLETAMNANDLRVRAAAIEVYLAGYEIPQTPEHAAALIRLSEEYPETRTWSLWALALLGSRDVARGQVLNHLERYLTDPEEPVRQWAVEGLAFLGTERVIPLLLDALRNDPSAVVRERAACSLCSSGMTPRPLRWKAVPGLVELAGDASLDEETRQWVFQALEEISGQKLAREPEAWHQWLLQEAPPAAFLPIAPENAEERPRLRAVELLEPADAEVFVHVPRTLTLRWSTVPAAVAYSVEIDCYHCCENDAWCVDVGRSWSYVPDLERPEYTFDFVGAQNGRWRVWPVDAEGTLGEATPWREFHFNR